MATCIGSLIVIFSSSIINLQQVLAAEPRPLLDIYSYPSAYLVAMSSDDVLQLTDTPSEASETVESKIKFGGKILRPPMAFAFTNEDQKPVATEIGAANEQLDEKTEIHDEATQQQHVKEQKTDEKYEKGAGQLQSTEKVAKQTEKGEKTYESEHSSEKTKKGHHKEQDHIKSYSDKGAIKEEHHSDDDSFKEHEKGEDGEKKSKYSEKGDFKKGHSTKGEHVIHKVDEYEKKHEFFDEDHDEEDIEKDRGFHEERAHKKVDKEKGNHEKHNFFYGKHGKEGHADKGATYKDHKGHHDQGGHKSQYEVLEDSKDEKEKNDGWKWTFRKTVGHKPQHKSTQYRAPTHGAYFRVKIQEKLKTV